jgi:hypothetical protein
VAGSEGTIEFVRPTLRQRREGWGTRASSLVDELPGHSLVPNCPAFSLIHELPGHLRWFTNWPAPSLAHEFFGWFTNSSFVHELPGIFVDSRIAASSSLVHELPGIFIGSRIARHFRWFANCPAFSPGRHPILTLRARNI